MVFGKKKKKVEIEEPEEYEEIEDDVPVINAAQETTKEEVKVQYISLDELNNIVLNKILEANQQIIVELQKLNETVK